MPVEFNSALSRQNRHYTFEQLESRQLLASSVFITEFMAINNGSLVDGDGNTPDWIELHNAGSEAVDLSGWHLTDDPRRLDNWPFPAKTLGPDEYLLILASGQDVESYVDSLGHFHANFRLASSGEYLALMDSTHSVVQAFDRFPLQFADVSYGRGVSGELRYFQRPTPGATNADGFAGLTQDLVSFSHESGTFVDTFQLSLRTGAGDKTIHYTLDGTVPTEHSPAYTGPLEIVSSMQIRARVIEPGRIPGPTNSVSLIRLAPEVAQFTSPLPIMVIDNFAAGPVPNRGWNQTNAGIRQVPRQAASMMLFARDGDAAGLSRSPDLSTRIGIRVRGSSSSGFSEPPYAFEAWSNQDDNDVDIAPLGIDKESDWLLYAPNVMRDRPLIKNTFLFQLSHQMGHWAPEFQYVEAFVNTGGGELTMDDYVGLYVLMENVKRSPSRLDFESFSPDAAAGGWLLGINRMDPISLDGQLPRNFHTAGPDGVLETPRDLFDSSSTGDDIPAQYNAYINFEDPNGYEINPAQRQAIEGWMHQMEQVLYGRADVPWNDPVDGYAKYIDVDSFIDHYILHNFSKHNDALLLSMWLYNPDPARGGKLQFGPIWDVDLAAFEGSPQTDLLYRSDTMWYKRLFEDPSFLQRYFNRWQELRSGPFSDGNMIAIIDGFFSQIGSEVAERDGVPRWTRQLDLMKQWVVDRAAAFDTLFLARPTFDVEKNLTSAPQVTIASIEGNVHYTLDGTDPMLPDGGIAPGTHVIGRSTKTLVGPDAPATAIVPDSALHTAIGEAWKGLPADEPFDVANWLSGTASVGYDTTGNYTPLIGTQINAPASTVFVRVPFNLEEPLPNYDFLTLNMQYDDGFVAYLNGVEIARASTRGEPRVPLSITALAARTHNAQIDAYESFDVSGYRDLLRPGANVLAIHGVNASPTNPDLLMRPELAAGWFARATIALDTPMQITARSLVGNEWSGLSEGFFGRGETIMIGDSNRDGVFNQRDLVAVLQLGKFNTRRPATFREGDWNGDGVFDQLDLVVASQDAKYLASRGR